MMKLKKTFYLLLMGTIFAMPALAENIELEELLDASRQSNPEVISSRYDLLIAETASENAWSVFIPDVRLNTAIIQNQAPWKEDPELLPTGTPFDYMNYTNNLVNQSIINPDIDPWTGSFGASAEWIFTPALFSGINLISEQKEFAQIQLEIKQKETELQVIELFYNTLNLQDQIAVIDSSISLTEKRVEQSKISSQAGLITDIEMKQAELGLYKLKTLRQQLETSLLRLHTALSLSTGMDFSENVVFIPPQNEVSSLSDNDSLSDNSHLLHLSKAIGLQELKTANLFEQKLLPVLALKLDVNSALNGVFNSESYDDPSLHHSFTFSAALSIPVSSLIPGSQAQSRIAEENLRIKKLENQYATLLAKLKTDFTLLKNEIRYIEESLLENQAARDLTRDIYLGIELSYKNGGATYLDVEEAQFNLLQKEQEGIALKYKRDILLYKINALFY